MIAKRSVGGVVLTVLLLCALSPFASQAMAGQNPAAKKRAAVKKLQSQRSLLQRQLQKNPRLLGSRKFMKAAVRFQLALPGELRIPACEGRWRTSSSLDRPELHPVGNCLLISFWVGHNLDMPQPSPMAAWGVVPMTVTFLGGRPYEIALTMAATPMVTDDSLRTIILSNSSVTKSPVGPLGDPWSGCSDITSAPGYLASDAFAGGGASAYPPPINDAVFSMANRISIRDGMARVNPFRRSIEGNINLRLQTVGISRELDNEMKFHCMNAATGSTTSDLSLSFTREPGLSHDFVPAADGSIRLAKVELKEGPMTREEIPVCLVPVAPADINLSVLGLGDFRGIPDIAWSTPCNSPVPAMEGANPFFGHVIPTVSGPSSFVELRPNTYVESMEAELVLLSGGHVPETG